MDEVGAAVAADAAALQLERGVAQRGGIDIGEPHVDGAALQVQAALATPRPFSRSMAFVRGER